MKLSDTLTTESQKELARIFKNSCSTSVVGTESTLHQLSPYIGKIKSSIARFLLIHFTKHNQIVYDPFCGAGTIPLEGLFLARNVIANDLNTYAYILTKGKVFPPISLQIAIEKIEKYDSIVKARLKGIDLRKVPKWVKAFYNKETLREIIAWAEILQKEEDYFTLSCLLGILHHQRPGFLSFPSSHTVPYLRVNKFPKNKFKELYEYRDVKSRLLKKVNRAFRRIPILHPSEDLKISKECYNRDATELHFEEATIDAVITSPPYMRQLDYARDNRLRLWFLGIKEYKDLDSKISPSESDFIEMMKVCLENWKVSLKQNGKCILFLGDNYLHKYKITLPDLIENIVKTEVKEFHLIFKHQSIIPNKRRVRRNYSGNKSETILVFEKL